MLLHAQAYAAWQKKMDAPPGPEGPIWRSDIVVTAVITDVSVYLIYSPAPSDVFLNG